ncbi:MAG: hypothetical protein WC580_06800 [Agrococcus sp.]
MRARTAAVVLLLGLVAGCTAAPPSPTPSATASEAPTQSPPPSERSTSAPSTTATASATTEGTSSTAARLDTTGWTTYVSEQYGFAIGRPPDWGVVSADRSWTLEVDAGNWESPAQEMFWSADGDIWMSAWTAPYAGEQSLAGVHRWVDDYCRRHEEPCGTDGTRVPLCNGRGFCQPGLLLLEEFPQAVFIGGVQSRSMTVIASGRQRDWPIAGYGSALEVLEAFLSTMDVCRIGEQNALGCDSDTPLAGAVTGDPLTTDRR